MNSVFSQVDDERGLEKRFVLGTFALLASAAVGCYAFAALHTTLFIPALLVVVVGIVAAGLAHFSLFRPLKRLALMAHAIGVGDFSKRLGLDRRDEIGRVALEMDTMCDQLEAAQFAAEAHLAALEQLRHSDRIATLGRLASSVAHELGNPLNVIELRAQLITSGEAGTLAQAQQSAFVIVEQTHRMTRIIDEILSFARMQPAKIARIDLVEVLRKAIALSDHTSKKQNTNIQLQAHRSAVEIEGDADKLLQMFVNLVVNGVQAMSRGGTVRVRTGEVDRRPIDDPEGTAKHYVWVDVIDQGSGIPAALLTRVFEPFFSTKSTEGGTGLGLSVAKGIASEHDGWITAESELGHGATFHVHLPQAGPSQDAS